jgi:hypothetical protein
MVMEAEVPEVLAVPGGATRFAFAAPCDDVIDARFATNLIWRFIRPHSRVRDC